ncbi:MAG: DNA internalization-related competence protein ComEC/Rec2 [Acidobacteria bacterium]|nr:DNA internalization-related competence protein ComEC/Rec2 [Acidobacteriota bacterium]
MQSKPLIQFLLFHPCLVLAALVSVMIWWLDPWERPRIELDPEQVWEVKAWVARPPTVEKDFTRFELQPISVTPAFQGKRYPGRILLTVPNHRYAKGATQSVEFGEILQFRGYLDEPRHHFIPGVGDYREYLWNEGIFHEVSLKSWAQIERHGSHPVGLWLRPLFRWSKRFEDYCSRKFRPEELKLVLSLFLGRKNTLDIIDRNILKQLGIIHIFVVSGLQVTVLIYSCHFLLARLGLARPLITLLVVCAYVILVGFSAPVVRSAVMATAAYFLLFFGLRPGFLNVLGLSAILFLVWSPRSLFSPSFQFSYVSVAAIGVFVVPFDRVSWSVHHALKELFTSRVRIHREGLEFRYRCLRFFLEEHLERCPRSCSRVLGVSAPAVRHVLNLIYCSILLQVLLLPLTVRYSNLWVWTQSIHNLLFVPLFSVMTPACLALFLFFPLPFSEILASVINIYAILLNALIRGLASFTWVEYFRQPRGWEIGAFFLVFMALYHLPWRRWWGTSAALGHAAALVVPVVLLWIRLHGPVPETGLLQLTLLDVGQGESMHILYPDGTSALVDTGGTLSASGEPVDFVGERLVAPYLWSQGARQLSYVVLTHPHVDHTQGFNFLKRAFPIRTVYGFAPAPPRLWLKAGQRFAIAGVVHHVLHPPAKGRGDYENTSNNRSIVMTLRYRDFSALLTGDIASDVEETLTGGLHQVTALKVAHHGSRFSSSPDFLAVTQPQLALISAGRRNLFGHPSAVTLQRLRSVGALVYTTSQAGTLRIETNGNGWKLLRYSGDQKEFKLISIRHVSTENSVGGGQ